MALCMVSRSPVDRSYETAAGIRFDAGRTVMLIAALGLALTLWQANGTRIQGTVKLPNGQPASEAALTVIAIDHGPGEIGRSRVLARGKSTGEGRFEIAIPPS